MTTQTPSSDTAILTIDGLTVALPRGADRRHAVKGASLELFPREILCVVGESGSGKSVLSAALMGAVPKGLAIESGRILLQGKDLALASERELTRIRGRDIAMIFQEPMSALNPALTVGEQIEEMFVLHTDLAAEARRARTRALVEAMHLPDPDRILASYPHELSGGQCQRVVIAMALALDPKVLIADEPTTALDVTTQAQVLKLIRELKDSHGHGILFITHDFGVVADIADRIAVMRGGEIVEIGTARQVLTQPAHDYTRALIAAVPSLTPRAPRAARAAEPVLEISSLEHHYGRTKALNDISLTLRRGEVVSIVGESGSGKSTLAKAAIRLIDPTGGAISVSGTPFLALKGGALRQKRRLIQMVFQDPVGSLNPRRTVGEMISRAAILSGASRAEATRRAEDLLELVGLQKSAYHRRPAAFSGGQRQRVGIARALAMHPEVLIADESVSALDVSVQAQVLELLKSLQEKLNLGILFITHDLRVAAQISDEIVVMHKGRIVEKGPAEAVLLAPQDPYTRSLIEAAPGRGSI
ncbi:dipeptide ABC transporter ATP-binding protein [Pannonibacter tanglangensis]|uniref:Dipeptide ABC transporter ATP-binding protein n=1 Tax=Pannonibacter tanglangensis TaxID=2750084 RepID=A0ABW9ZIY4_9HYPH|nr:ABC transporter ATP-binding protein [Pannonibacter sp. XCT-34]NBN64003.1 dipeptide ABC transporter ATP-binding protein [Pannonibacter sp. XCT-34]